MQWTAPSGLHICRFDIEQKILCWPHMIFLKIPSYIGPNFFQCTNYFKTQFSNNWLLVDFFFAFLCKKFFLRIILSNVPVSTSSREKRPFEYPLHYVWLSQFWSHFCGRNALFASKAKINVVWNFFELRVPGV